MPGPLDYLKQLWGPTTPQGMDIALPDETFVGPRQSASNDPLTALRKASTIGPSQVGERYDEPANPGVLDLIRRFTSGPARPSSVAAQDPYGIDAWQKGAGSPPVMVGAIEPTSAGLSGMYSRVQRAAETLPDVVHPSKALSHIKNAASKEEINYRGLSDFLQGSPSKVSKADILSHLEDNPMPEIGVKTLGGNSNVADDRFTSGYQPDTSQPTLYNRADLNVPGGKNYQERLLTIPHEEVPDTGSDLAMGFTHPEPQYHSTHWDDPNVLAHSRFDERELPHPTGKWAADDFHVKENLLDADQGPLWNVQKTGHENMGSYTGVGSTPNEARQNVAEWLNSGIGTPPKGPKGRFLQEIQSDWHQQGKALGYYTAVDKGVPDAPFKESWPDLTLKQHVLDVAGNPDLSWLGFTTGQTQADRYDLSKQVSRFTYDPNEFRLRAYDAEGIPVVSHNVEPENLHHYIGREAADKLLTSESFHENWRDPAGFTVEPNMVHNWDFDNQGADAPEKIQQGWNVLHNGQGYASEIGYNRPEMTSEAALQSIIDENSHWNQYELSGQNLKIGGEGMKTFYDKKLPSALEKILKPFGGKVEQSSMTVPRGTEINYDPSMGKYGVATEQVGPQFSRESPKTIASRLPDADRHEFIDYVNAGRPSKDIPIWLAHLPPEMKAAILKKGLPLLTLLGLTQASQQDPGQTPIQGLKQVR